MQNILFVIDKTEVKYFEFNKLITDFWLIKEFLARGEKVFITTSDRLSLKNAVPYIACFETYFERENIFYKKEAKNFPVENFSLLMFRPDPPVDLNYINATYILDFVSDKTKMINLPAATRNFNEKLHANLFWEFMPDNLVTSNNAEILDFLATHKEIVLKPLNQCFGGGVMHLKENDKNVKKVVADITQKGTTLTMVQKYIPDVKFGDKRVLTLGDEVLSECVLKLPGKGDFKFNTHSDEFIKKGVLSESERQKFSRVAKKLNSMGISMAGLDVIDEKIIEVNVTSPCYFINEINRYFSIELEKRIVDFIESQIYTSTNSR